jgi:HAD superfamily hydrolase (TIGR01490 family)
MISSMSQTANVPAPAEASTNIGAFFDIDGTLLPAPSLERRFASFLLAHDKIHVTNIIRWLAHGAATLLFNPRLGLGANKYYLGHLPESVVADWETSISAGSPAADSLPLFAEGIERIFWHLAQGHRVFLVSGTLAPLARIFAKRFRDTVSICATELEVRDGHWTGRLAGEHLSGAAKTRAMLKLGRKYDLSLARSYAYGNDVADGLMLGAVGHAVAVNPSKPLVRLAKDRGWQVRHWIASQAAHGKNGLRLIPAKGAR